ncbi:MAG: glycosyltransferase [Nanoarchaeota archaeon]|nr:glycosyltransferase [Nanoarchaeota archaeon]
MAEMKVDIVIPLYNEEKILEKSVNTLVDFLYQSIFPYDYSIILANNASTDDSLNICNKLSNKYTQVRYLDIGGKGKGLAVRTSWSKSDADILVFMDIDLASDLNFLRHLVDSVAVDKNDMVIGNRRGPKSKVFSDKITRRFASKVFNFMVQLILKSPFIDHQCGFKAISKEKFNLIAPFLNENGFFIDTELIIISLAYGLKIQPIDIIWRDGRNSKVSLFGDSVKMFMGILRLWWRLKNKLNNKL